MQHQKKCLFVRKLTMWLELQKQAFKGQIGKLFDHFFINTEIHYFYKIKVLF